VQDAAEVATPPSTSTAAPGITEDILASQEPGLITQHTQATVSGKTAPDETVDIAVGQPGTAGNTTVIVQAAAGSDGSFRAVVPTPARPEHPDRDRHRRRPRNRLGAADRDRQLGQ